MKISSKIFFVITGLVIIACGFFFGKSHIVEAALKSGQKFGDWTVACTKDKNKVEVCFLSQQLNTTKKDEKTQVLAIYQIGYFGKDKTLRMIQILPLGIDLQAGTSIISQDKLISPGKFVICDSTGCQAAANISSEDLTSIISNSPNYLGFVGVDGKQLNLPISNTGLKEGLEAISSK